MADSVGKKDLHAESRNSESVIAPAAAAEEAHGERRHAALRSTQESGSPGTESSLNSQTGEESFNFGVNYRDEKTRLSINFNRFLRRPADTAARHNLVGREHRYAISRNRLTLDLATLYSSFLGAGSALQIAPWPASLNPEHVSRSQPMTLLGNTTGE
ncbi:MAG TPA: hypothetical protein VGS02_02100 [Acidobacteriaceae bacterium]|nr:hypothetical protein [Acidobacteriaceae bacterium]